MRYFVWYALLLLGGASAAAQGISVSPSRIFFTGDAGGRVTESLAIANPGSRSVSFRVFLRDFYRDSLGEKIYLAPASSNGSNASWIEGLPDIIDLAPGERRDVPIHLHIPDDTAISQHGVTRCMLFLSQIQRPDTSASRRNTRNMGIQIRLEMGVQVYYTPAHCTTRGLTFLAFDDRGMVDTARRYAIRIRNNGEVSADATLRVELTNQLTGAEVGVPEHRLTMLPGAEMVVYLDLPRLSGRYLAVAFLDTGDQNELQVARKDIIY